MKPKTIAALILIAFFIWFCAGCAWMKEHQTQLRNSALIIGKRVAVVAGQVALETVINSHNPAATMNWQEYAAQSVNSQKWNLINGNDVQALADVWKAQTPALVPAADTFTTLWNTMQPRSQAEVDAFLKAFAAAQLQPRNTLPDFK